MVLAVIKYSSVSFLHEVEVKIEKGMECFDFSRWDGEWY